MNVQPVTGEPNWQQDALQDALQSNDFAESLINSSLDGILAFDRDCCYTVWNPTMERITGMSRAQVVGRRAFDIFPFLKETGEDEVFHEVLAGRSVATQDRMYVVPETGQQGYFEGHYSPVRDASGGVVGGLAVIREITQRRREEEDIRRLNRALEDRVAERTAQLEAANKELETEVTEHKSTEEALRRSRDQLTVILQGVGDGITLQGPTGKLLYANEIAARTMGFSSAEALLETPVAEVMQKFEVLDEARQPFPMSMLPGRYALQGIESPEKVLCWRVVATEEEHWSIVRARPVYDAQGRVQLAINIFQDITERKKHEEEMQRRMAELESIYQISTAAARAMDLGEIYERALDGLQRTLRADKTAILLYDADEVMRFKAWRGLSDDYRKLAEGHSPWPRDAKDPQPLFVPDVLDEPSLADLQETIICEGIRALGFIPLVYQGRLLGKFMVYFGRPRHFSEGDARVAQTIASHIAFSIERRRAEEERTQLLLSEHQARIEAEGAVHTRDELLSVVSHDLKNPLAAITGNAQLLKRRIGQSDATQPERLTEVVERINEAAGKMSALINELMDFGRLQVGQSLQLERALSDLVGVVRLTVDEQQRTTARHRILFKTEAKEITGLWDAGRLDRVLANLLSNAIKYSPNGGDVMVRLRREQASGREWAVLVVTDQGIGIPAADLPYIFEWFRRGENTSGRISGAGIGLASAKQIIEQHGGSISVESEEGAGTTFTVRLPVETSGPEEKRGKE
jgi:PAS domain S-box-containing protein